MRQPLGSGSRTSLLGGLSRAWPLCTALLGLGRRGSWALRGVQPRGWWPYGPQKLHMWHIQAHTPSCAPTQISHQVLPHTTPTALSWPSCPTGSFTPSWGPTLSSPSEGRWCRKWLWGGLVWERREGWFGVGCGAELSHGGCSRVISQDSLCPFCHPRFTTNSQLVLQPIPN